MNLCLQSYVSVVKIQLYRCMFSVKNIFVSAIIFTLLHLILKECLINCLLFLLKTIDAKYWSKYSMPDKN